MTARISVGLVVLLLLAGQPVQAGERTGWGLSAGVGGSRIRDTDGDETFSGNDLALIGEIEYRFTPNFALGFGGFSLGRAEDTVAGIDTEIEAHGFELFGRLVLPLSDTAEIYGRIGAANYRVDVDPGIALVESLFGDDATAFGLGIDFGRREKLAFRIEGRYFDGSSDESGALLVFGVNYLF